MHLDSRSRISHFLRSGRYKAIKITSSQVRWTNGDAQMKGNWTEGNDPDMYAMKHLGGVRIGNDQFWVRKMTKMDWDQYEREYSYISRSNMLMKLMTDRAESLKAWNDKKIPRDEYIRERDAIDAEIEKVQGQARVTKDYEINGKTYTLYVSNYAAADKLSRTVLVPKLDKKGEVVYIKETDIPDKIHMPIEFWLTLEDTMFTKLSQIVDEIQFYGLDEPISALEDAAALFNEDIEPVHPEEIRARLILLRDQYSSGELYRKKSNSAYGVQISLPK